jgi:SAM-dependent methyltransferase
VEEDQGVVVITVFAGQPEALSFSAFARHLHAKWGLSDNDVVLQRRAEDEKACNTLGALPDHWSLLEAPYRQDKEGRAFYCTYDALRGDIAPEDLCVKDQVSTLVLSRLEQARQNELSPILYFPMGLNPHVDHQILAEVGKEIYRKGNYVLFYEEWPSAEALYLTALEETKEWTPIIESVQIEKKVKSAGCYSSQVLGLGGTIESLGRRLLRYASHVGSNEPSERIWKPEFQPDAVKNTGSQALAPFASSRHKRWNLKDFREFIRCLQWHDLDEVLSPGKGMCLDVGCGSGRHRQVVEQAGYRWIGLDYQSPEPPVLIHVRGDAQNLPVASERLDGVVLWGVLSYLEKPEVAVVEVSRVLKAGGVFCGYAPFLEPIHGLTFYAMSPLLLERLLHKHGFADVKVIPGISGFRLILWTWLRRYGGNWLASLALPITWMWLIPSAATRFFMSWLWWRFGYGEGHGLRWISERVPLEFAGHVIFSARKCS